jgi:hypothetical protein
MSFDNISFIKHNLAKLTNNTISIRFRTTLSSGILFAWDMAYMSLHSYMYCSRRELIPRCSFSLHIVLNCRTLDTYSHNQV